MSSLNNKATKLAIFGRSQTRKSGYFKAIPQTAL